MSINSITSLKNLSGKRVLVRVDFNVPVKNGKVVDDKKIKVSIPTIKYLLKKKVKLILLTHLGRPEGYNGKGKSGYDKKFDLLPVVKKVNELLSVPVKFIADKKIGRSNDQDIYFDNARNEIDKMKVGEVVMLENLRFFPEEAKETAGLSKKIATLGDIYVFDGFAVAHRKAASITGVAKLLPSYAGLLLSEEIRVLSKVMNAPKKPLVVLLGGAKAETKIPVVKKLLPKADFILVGGGFFSTYLWARGFKVGGSIVQSEFKVEILKYGKSKKIIFPVDVIVGRADGSGAKIMPVNAQFKIVNKNFSIFDIGPATVQLYAEYIKKAQTLIWNGAMGRFEVPPYQYGTFSLTYLFAARSKGKAFGVCGGGETVQVFEKLKVADQVDLVSTGGGAMLEFLSGKKLPGIEALRG